MGLIAFGSCNRPTKEQPAELRAIDSLTGILDNYREQITLLSTDSIENTLRRIRFQINSGHWDYNAAAMQSLQSAEGFISELPDNLYNLHEQMKLFVGQAEDFVQLAKHEQETQNQPAAYVTEFQKHVNAFTEQYDYLISRYNAQLLLVETLENDRAKNQ